MNNILNKNVFKGTANNTEPGDSEASCIEVMHLNHFRNNGSKCQCIKYRTNFDTFFGTGNIPS